MQRVRMWGSQEDRGHVQGRQSTPVSTGLNNECTPQSEAKS